MVVLNKNLKDDSRPIAMNNWVMQGSMLTTVALRANSNLASAISRHVGPDFSLPGPRLGVLHPLAETRRRNSVKSSQQWSPGACSDDDLMLPNIRGLNVQLAACLTSSSTDPTAVQKRSATADRVQLNYTHAIAHAQSADGAKECEQTRATSCPDGDSSTSSSPREQAPDRWDNIAARKSSQGRLSEDRKDTHTVAESSLSCTSSSKKKKKRSRKKTKNHKNKSLRNRSVSAKAFKASVNRRLTPCNSISHQACIVSVDYLNGNTVPLQTHQVKISQKSNLKSQKSSVLYPIIKQGSFSSVVGLSLAQNNSKSFSNDNVATGGKASSTVSKAGGTEFLSRRSQSLDVEVRKPSKVYYSERQSGTLKELGLEFPCAPPATPLPDFPEDCEYVPSMNDIRSQRAVKVRLKALNNAQKDAQEKLKEDQHKKEKLSLSVKAEDLRKQQRLQIYALNKVMSELEEKNFAAFCKHNSIPYRQ